MGRRSRVAVQRLLPSSPTLEFGRAPTTPWRYAVATDDQFLETFLRLKAVLAVHAPHLAVVTDTPTVYTLHAPDMAATSASSETFLSSIQIKKRYVSFHLMPVYYYPDLLNDLPPRLEARRHGKSCFNFTRIDDATVEDLARLTAASFDRDRRERMR